MLRPTSMSESVYAALKRDIIRCVLPPGQIVVESALAETYGTSKTPIREALGALSREGFIQTLPRRGTLITPISVQDVQHTFFLRMLMQPEAAALAANRATGEQLKHLARLSEAASAYEDSNSHAWADLLQANREFHVAVAQMSGIPRLASMISGLLEEVERFYNSHGEHEHRHTPEHNHRQLLEAIVSGDADQARLVVSEGIRASRQHLIESLLDDQQIASMLRLVGDNP